MTNMPRVDVLAYLEHKGLLLPVSDFSIEKVTEERRINGDYKNGHEFIKGRILAEN